MAALFQREKGIDHAQARAEDQDRRLGIERGVRLRTHPDCAALEGARLLVMAGGQHGEMADDAGAVGQGHLDARRGRRDRQALLTDQPQAAALALAFLEIVEQFLQIAGIEAARRVEA